MARPRPIRFARSARRHRIGRAHAAYVFAHSGRAFELAPPAGAPAGPTTPHLYVGDDDRGRALEVLTVLRPDGGLLVIHAMDLRHKLHACCLQAKRWAR